MARHKSPTLTEAELRLMNVLWDQGGGTVGDVLAALPKSPVLAFSTVLTTLRILEDKGYVRHRKAGRAFRYEPLVDRERAGRSAIRYLVSRFFRNSPSLLVLNLLKNERLNAAELRRLRQMIEEER